ncbi:T9SS type A sorting domain-containing protein [Pseudofulvibacter geojedonensis]|uniref:T9SS type A sorting domain-containing protein n=1 Tax=Pseudofulvibacter geojedonensis TaxID=1123758 RepID=A0ABW3I5M0_9FLAO
MIRKLLFTGAFLIGSYATFGQTELWSESFEDDGVGAGRYTVSSQFMRTDSDDDYFGRVDAQTLIYQDGNTPSGFPINVNAVGNYMGANGSFYIAAEDTDNTTGTIIGTADGLDEKIVTFTGIDISGGTTLTFTGLFARGETDACGVSTYDDTDYIRVYCQVDGGADNLIMQFAPDLECNIPADVTNEPLHHDIDMDGDGGDGPVLTNTLTEFSASIPDGSTANIRLEIHMDAASEEIAFDYLRIMATNPLSVSNESLEKGVQVYPNPSNGLIKIKKANGIELTTLEVYNLLGDKVQRINLTNMDTIKTLDLTNLASGIYITKIQDVSGAILTKKIVIE